MTMDATKWHDNDQYIFEDYSDRELYALCLVAEELGIDNEDKELMREYLSSSYLYIDMDQDERMYTCGMHRDDDTIEAFVDLKNFVVVDTKHFNRYIYRS